MDQHAIDLQDRTRRFAAAIATLCERLPADPGAQRTAAKLLASSRAVTAGYTDTCASPSPDSFISRISAVAAQAKRTRASLQLLLQLNHVTIEAARDLLFEARGLEAIFVASRDTAKRRHRARLGGAGERAARASPVAVKSRGRG